VVAPGEVFTVSYEIKSAEATEVTLLDSPDAPADR
jgi:hypothetical protein